MLLGTYADSLELDPEKKDYQWATKLVTILRQHMEPLVSYRNADGQKIDEDPMVTLLNGGGLDYVKKMFQKPDELGFNFIPIAIIEKIRNTITAERESAGINLSLNAIDTSAQRQRKKDKELLKNRKTIESVMTSLNRDLNLPNYELTKDEDENGKSLFNGNVEQFDELGLNDSDSSDVEFFFKAYHQLLHEIAGNKAINYFVQYNQLQKNIEQWCNDIMAYKKIAMRSYVNESSGAIELKYISPKSVRWVPTSNPNGKDSPAKSVEYEVAIGEFLKMIGNEFDINRDYDVLLRVVNNRHGSSFTSISYNGHIVYSKDGDLSKSCQYSDFLQYKIPIGYIEWKSLDASSYKVGTNYHGNLRYIPKKISHTPDPSSGYAKEVFYNEVTYKSYYVNESPSTQTLYKFGKLYYQNTEGAEDEYSNFTILFEQAPGPTVVEIAKPFIDIAQETFYKLKWFIRKAKPRGRSYSYDSLIEIAKNMMSEEGGSTAQSVMKVVQMFSDGLNELYTYPQVDGQPMGGGSNPNHDIRNGLDESAKTFTEFIDWSVRQILEKIGINTTVDAYSSAAPEGYKLQSLLLQQSRKATEYINKMIMSLLGDCSKSVLSAVQDISRFKSSIPYKFLETALGEDTIKVLIENEGFAFHRYGIFIDTFNNDLDRERIIQEAYQAWQNKEIEYHVLAMIKGIDDPKQATLILSYQKEKAKKEAQQILERNHKMSMELQAQKTADELRIIDRKGEWVVKGKEVEGEMYFRAHKATADARIRAKEMDIESQPGKFNEKANAEIAKERAKKEIDNQSFVE